MSNQLFLATYLIILLAYIVGSIVMIYHIFAFGINSRVAIISTIAYILGSILLLIILYSNLQTILSLTN
jgi:cytochrome c oxidase assembly factor CtaG